MKPVFDLILFDLGGVLVDISGSNETMQFMKQAVPAAEFWRRWLYCSSVRTFESGQCDSETFAARVVEELDLSVTPARFIESYKQWVRGPFPGALELLEKLSAQISLGCLSNTNPHHWPLVSETMALGRYFKHPLISYQIGMMKPDAEIFEYAIKTTGHPPSRILFLDDNDINVQSAQRCGLTALYVQGLEDAKTELKELGFAV